MFVFLASATSQGAPELISVVETLQGKKLRSLTFPAPRVNTAAAAVFYSRASRRVVPLRASAHKHCIFFFFYCSTGAECSNSSCFSCREWTIATMGQTDKKKKMENNRASMIWLHLWLFFFFLRGSGGVFSTGGAGMEQKDVQDSASFTFHSLFAPHEANMLQQWTKQTAKKNPFMATTFFRPSHNLSLYLRGEKKNCDDTKSKQNGRHVIGFPTPGSWNGNNTPSCYIRLLYFNLYNS